MIKLKTLGWGVIQVNLSGLSLITWILKGTKPFLLWSKAGVATKRTVELCNICQLKRWKKTSPKPLNAGDL